MSLRGMLEETRALAARLGYRIEAERVEDGVSGGSRNRPEYRAWLADATEHRVDALLSYSVDRVTRVGLASVVEVFDVIEATGVRLVDCTGTDSTLPGFELTFGMRALVAREELQRIKARNRDAHRRAREQGRHMTGRPGFGWRAEERPGGGFVVRPDEGEAALLVEAADGILAGATFGAAARALNRAGAVPRRAAQWRAGSLAAVLLAERNEPLLGPVRRAALVALREAQPGPAPGGRKPAQLLSGVAVCGGCEMGMVAASRRRPSDGVLVPTYRCSSYSDMHPCGARTSIDAGPLERDVEAAYLADFGPLPVWQSVLLLDDSALLAARVEHKAALAAISSSATPENFARLQAAAAAVVAEEESLPEPTRARRDTGRTRADEYAAFDAVADKRAALAEVLFVVVRKPGTGARVSIEWLVDVEQLRE